MQNDVIGAVTGDGGIMIIIVNFEDADHHSTGRAVRGRPYKEKEEGWRSFHELSHWIQSPSIQHL